MEKQSLRRDGGGGAEIFCYDTMLNMELYIIHNEQCSTLYNSKLSASISFFLRFHKETKVMPVIWHQTLLAFVQRYKHELRKEDKKSLTSLLEKQNHELITPDIVRELVSSRNRGEMDDNSHSASTINNKPIKEDWFDMPQVPMEEDK
ncbi:hypothetical protein N665_0234s0034 [Sinapis alba]|nr:hypothetical protein N665_0234s0034 [Sinapis alba]